MNWNRKHKSVMQGAFILKDPVRGFGLRICLVSLYALGLPLLLKFIFARHLEFDPPVSLWLLAGVYLVLFNLNIEVNLAVDRYLNEKLSWVDFPRKRLLVQLFLVVLVTLIIIVFPILIWYSLTQIPKVFPAFPFFAFISHLTILVLFLGSSISTSFFEQWKASLLHAEKLKQEKLKSDYRALQNQVNPHFLFNCLNVLISEINLDPAAAEVFARKLSMVYRYMLQSKNHELITLEKELEHVDAYIFLHQVRSGYALKLTINIAEEALACYLPPLTLQILVENAIKHTVMNEDNPLFLCMETVENRILILRNNLNPKEALDSTGVGLSNIKARYALLDGARLQVTQTECEFIVRVPLLEVIH